MRALVSVAAFALLLGSTVDSFAAGWGALLQNTPMEDFSDEDLSQYFKVLNATLNAPMPVAPAKWRNERTGSGATIEILGEPKLENFDDCRRVRTDLYSKKRKNLVRVWTACRGADGNWFLASAK
jgi:hypothetical protein